MMTTILNIGQLANKIHKTPGTIRNLRTPALQRLRPNALPPSTKLPGTNRLFWRLEDVEAWMLEGSAK